MSIFTFLLGEVLLQNILRNWRNQSDIVLAFALIKRINLKPSKIPFVIYLKTFTF